MSEGGRRMQRVGVLGFVLTAVAVVAMTAASFRRSAAQAPPAHPASATAAVTSRTPPPAGDDALSALQPSEMMKGCLECPVASFLGEGRRLR